MRLGVACTLAHSSPEEWAEKNRALGLGAVVFPCAYTDSVRTIDAYAEACRAADLRIAEVGAWRNLLTPDAAERRQNLEFCVGQLELAEYIGADCCVNIAGTPGPVWDGAFRENYSQRVYEEIVARVQEILDRVNPKKTFYTLEPMPWMHPWSAEDYRQLLDDVARDGFGVHMDICNLLNTPEKYLFNREFTDRAFSLLGPWIKSCHVKDVVLRPSLPTVLQEVLPGQGGVDLVHYIESACSLSPDMPLIIEHLEDEKAYETAIQYILQAMKEERENEQS